MGIHEEEFLNILSQSEKKNAKQCTYNRNIQARPRKHCCLGEAMSIIQGYS